MFGGASPKDSLHFLNLQIQDSILRLGFEFKRFGLQFFATVLKLKVWASMFGLSFEV
jgi:hypothetical protein